MQLFKIMRVVPTLLACVVLASEGAAAVGAQENIIIVRNDTFSFQQLVFGVVRTSSNSFSTLPFPDLFVPNGGSGGGGFGDPLKFADVNGDGIDDMLAIQDARAFSTIANPNDINDPNNILNDKLQIAALTQEIPFSFGGFNIMNSRVDGNVQFDTNEPTGLVSIAEVITRRDFDGDNLADTAIITDGNFFGSDVLLWAVRGSESDSQMTNLILNPAGDFYNAGQTTFGTPVGQESIPLVGDFNGDGVLDRAISNNAGLVSAGGINGRLIQIDLSPAEETFGDGIPDNGNSDVVGIADDDTVRVADINGDGLDDIVAYRPVLLDDGEGGTISTFELQGYVNQGNISDMGTDPIFVEDDNFSTLIGSPDLGDTIEFGVLGLIETVPGDYNDDGVVNAADYTVFRDNEGQSVTLHGEDPSATTPGFVDQEDYTWWVTNYGLDAPPAAASTAVPEPTSLLILAFAALRVASTRR